MYDVVAHPKKPGVEVIDLALTAKLGNLSAVVCTQDHMVTDIKIAGFFPSFLLYCVFLSKMNFVIYAPDENATLMTCLLALPVL